MLGKAFLQTRTGIYDSFFVFEFQIPTLFLCQPRPSKRLLYVIVLTKNSIALLLNNVQCCSIAIEPLCNQGSTWLFSFLEIACSTKEVSSFIGFDTHLKPNVSTQLNLYKSDNLQYNTLVCWVTGMNDSSSKRLMFQVLFFFS